MERERSQGIIARYRANLLTVRGLSPRTVESYVYEVLRLFCAVGNCDPALIMRADIESYLANMTTGPRTIARLIASIRNFFRWAVEAGIAKADPTVGLHCPKLPVRLPIHVPGEAVNALLSAPTGEHGVRDRAVIATFLYTGCRLSELRGLRLSDWNRNTQTLRIIGKGNRERIVPVHPRLREILEEYLGTGTGQNREQLFPCSGNAIHRLVKRWTRIAGIAPLGLSCHKLRHTFGTLLHEAGVDLIEIQQLMGHSNIQTTSIYTHTNGKLLAQAVGKLS